MANIGFSQRAAYSGVDTRFPTEILYTESDFLWSDVTMWSLTQSLPAIFLPLGLLLMFQLRMDRGGWLQLRAQGAAASSARLRFTFWLDYHAGRASPNRCHLPDTRRRRGFQFARFTMAGAAFLNSLVVVLTLRPLSSINAPADLRPWRISSFSRS